MVPGLQAISRNLRASGNARRTSRKAHPFHLVLMHGVSRAEVGEPTLTMAKEGVAREPADSPTKGSTNV